MQKARDHTTLIEFIKTLRCHSLCIKMHSQRQPHSCLLSFQETNNPKVLTRSMRVMLSQLVGNRFQVLFHSPNRGSFHLSLTVLCAIGVFVYLAFAGGPAIFTQDFTCPVLLRINPKSYFCFGYEALTLYDAPFQASSPTKVICNSLPSETDVDFPYPQFNLFKYQDSLINQTSRYKNNLSLG